MNWWQTGRSGMLQSMGSQRVRHDWATELNWTELNWTESMAIPPWMHLISSELNWTELYMYVCIFSHTFYCCYKPLPLHWVLAVLWSFPFFPLFSFFSILFSFLLYNFNFLKAIIFFDIYSFVCLSYSSFPLAINL